MLALKIIGIVILIVFLLFLLSLIIYFFNLDMKLAAAVTPIMKKYYDWRRKKRDAKKK